MVTRPVCSEVYWFTCGQLREALVDRHSVVLCLQIWLRRCGGVVDGMAFSRCLPVACCTLGCAAGLFVSGCFSLSGLVLMILD